MSKNRTGKQIGFLTRASFIAKVTDIGNIGYTCEDEQGNIIKGIAASYKWPNGTWVTVVKTADGLGILGTAATGPGQVYEEP